MHKRNQKILNIFHFDMNHVSLREDYIRNWLKRLADMGYNAILWELEDKVRWETCCHAIWPEAMSKDQFRSILDYSRELGFSAIPLLQTVGHGEYVMKHKAYAHMREQKDRCDCYCTSNPEVRKFLKEMIGEYLDLFGDIEYFHLGGDEAYVFATCPTCKAAAAEKSRNQIYAEHIMDIAKPIFKRDVRPGIWGDMILHYPEDVECVTKELAIWDWNYWDGVTKPEMVHLRQASAFVGKDQLGEDTLKTMPEIIDDQGSLRSFYTVDVLLRLGYDVFLCSSTRSWGDPFFCGKHSLHSANVIGAARKAFESKLLGHCVTSWAIRIFNLEIQQAWLEMACMDKGASKDGSYEKTVKKCGKDVLGIDAEGFFKAIEKIASDIPFVTSGPDYNPVIQWTGLKDSVPAPKGYMQSVLEKWNSTDEGREYKEKKAVLSQAVARISQGLNELKKIISRVSGSTKCDFFDQWLIAGEFQLRMANIVQKIFDRFEFYEIYSDSETEKELICFQEDCNSWMLNWMTPESAKLNSELIFKPLIEYFGQQEKR